jgi:hypothetical protein
MSLILSGTDGLSDVDGSASTPAIRGTDTNTGIFFPAADTIAFAEGGSEVARFDSSGNLGIGTTPNSWSSAFKAIDFAYGSVAPNINTTQFGLWNNLYVNGSGNVTYKSTAAGQNLALDNAGNFSFYNAPSGTAGTTATLTERMRINSSGNLAVGATSIANAAARAAIVNAGGGSIVMQIQRSGENASYIGSDNSDIFSVWDSAPTKRFAVTSAGSCQNTTGSYGTISDAKLKENIVDATPKLEKLMQLQVKNYAFKTSPEFKQIGFIAQELKEVFPSLIEETPDQDENGEKTGEVTLGVKTTVLIPILVKAIQEQQAIITDLKARIETLEAK